MDNIYTKEDMIAIIHFRTMVLLRSFITNKAFINKAKELLILSDDSLMEELSEWSKHLTVQSFLNIEEYIKQDGKDLFIKNILDKFNKTYDPGDKIDKHYQ